MNARHMHSPKAMLIINRLPRKISVPWNSLRCYTIQQKTE